MEKVSLSQDVDYFCESFLVNFRRDDTRNCFQVHIYARVDCTTNFIESPEAIKCFDGEDKAKAPNKLELRPQRWSATFEGFGVIKINFLGLEIGAFEVSK
jgi:hypothetical protein